MNFAVKTSLGILILLVLVYADIDQSTSNFDEQCQVLKCNPSTEICRINLKCDDSNRDDLSKCVYCVLKDDLNQNIVSKTLLASSISQREQPLAPRLLAKSGSTRLLADNRGGSISSSPTSITTTANKTSDDLSYDDYYEYDDDETSDKNEFGEEDDYLDDYAEPLDTVIQGSEPIRKLGVCPKVIESTDKCDPSKVIQSDCRFDTDCPGDHKCCEAACGRRVCNSPITTSVSVCPSSFTCTLNCRLGYRTDSNGCLLCECQSCPSMDQCNKNCPSGYLKDLFGCDICECSDQCPPFSCDLLCPEDLGFAKSKDGCSVCQCATTKSKPSEYTTSCQDDVHCPPGFRCLNDARNVPMCQAVPELAGPPSPTEKCPDNLAATCNLQCANGNFVLDTKGCPTCACSSDTSPPRIGKPPVECPLLKCQANCGDGGYQSDENGCRTCKCASTSTKETVVKPRVECSRVMCRMYCVHGFARNENGCEICKCNTSPQACPELTCDKTCSNGYRKDYSGCQTCQCQCPPATCPSNCTTQINQGENGCPTCTCVSTDDKPKPRVECSRVMCRMYCVNGFARNENGCEICKCNTSPQPCPELKCEKTCSNGYRKDYSGCQTCQCQCPPTTCPSDCITELKKDENGCSTCTCKDDGHKLIIDTGCSPMKCDLDCKYGFKRDASDCSLCSCNTCPIFTCRMFCMYGFKKNSDGCEMCECDWTPVSENIQCSERIPCTGNRVCNLNLKSCELVSPDKVNWFVYNFDVKSELFDDPKFTDTFKSGFINNVASKYDLEPSQIFVSSIEHDGMVSFQIMPYFIEDADDFQKKMDKIDIDLNSHEFRTVIPGIVLVIEKTKHQTSTSKWNRYQEQNPRFALYVTSVGLGLVALAFAGIFVLIFRQRVNHPTRSESKSPIYDTSYHQTATDDDHYHAVHAPDGTAYVVVESEDIQAPNDKRALV